MCIDSINSGRLPMLYLIANFEVGCGSFHKCCSVFILAVPRTELETEELSDNDVINYALINSQVLQLPYNSG